MQEPAGSGIIGQKTGIPVNGQEAFAHILRDQIKFVLFLTGVTQLLFYRLLLPGDLAKKRCQLLVGDIRLRCIQVKRVDRFNDRF